MRPRLRRIFYHQPRFDSMPHTPGMGYFMEGWGVHSPGFDHGVFLERTRGKIERSSAPRLRPTHANTRIRVSSFPLGINWEFNLHPRHIEAEFGYAWLEPPYGDEGRRRHVTSGPPYIPDPSLVWSDVDNHRRREHLAHFEHERVDPPKDPGSHYGPLGDADGIASYVPGLHFRAWQPLTSRAHHLILEARTNADDTVIRQYRLRLMHEPRFGLDEGDAYAFDILTRDVEHELLQETWAHTQPPCPACHEPLWTTHEHDGVTITAGDQRSTPDPTPV